MSNLEVIYDWHKPWTNDESWRKIYYSGQNANVYLYADHVDLLAYNMYNNRPTEMTHYVVGKNSMIYISYEVIFRGCLRYMRELYEETYLGKRLHFAKVQNIFAQIDDFVVRVDKLKAFI
jgi:hypothetical protein